MLTHSTVRMSTQPTAYTHVCTLFLSLVYPIGFVAESIVALLSQKITYPGTNLFTKSQLSCIKSFRIKKMFVILLQAWLPGLAAGWV